MWKTIPYPADEDSEAANGRVFSRVDPSNATVIYTAASLQNQPLGYYYWTRIGCDLYEIAGEIPEGTLSCILAPDKYRRNGPAALSGPIRLGRHGIGRLRVLDHETNRGFVFFDSIGGATSWAAKSIDDGVSVADSETGEFFRLEAREKVGLRQRLRETFQRLGTFTRPVPWLQVKPELRAALVALLAAMQSQSLINLPTH